MTTLVYDDLPVARLALYDWRNAPKWARYAATDSDGSAHFFASRPSVNRYAGRWDESSSDATMCDTRALGIASHWTQSLERRP